MRILPRPFLRIARKWGFWQCTMFTLIFSNPYFFLVLDIFIQYLVTIFWPNEISFPISSLYEWMISRHLSHGKFVSLIPRNPESTNKKCESTYPECRWTETVQCFIQRAPHGSWIRCVWSLNQQLSEHLQFTRLPVRILIMWKSKRNSRKTLDLKLFRYY